MIIWFVKRTESLNTFTLWPYNQQVGEPWALGHRTENPFIISGTNIFVKQLVMN